MYSILKFLFVGMSSTIIDLVVYFLLIKNNIDIISSKLVSMSIASIFSFAINKNWTFNYEKEISLYIIAKYVVNQIFNILCNVVTNAVVFKLTNMRLLSFLIATLFATILNFCLQKFFVFKKKN